MVGSAHRGRIAGMRKMEMSRAFAAVLKERRKALGMSQEKLAEKADIHPTHVGLIERSLRNPSINVAKAIADALGVSLADLVAQAERICRRRRP